MKLKQRCLRVAIVWAVMLPGMAAAQSKLSTPNPPSVPPVTNPQPSPVPDPPRVVLSWPNSMPPVRLWEYTTAALGIAFHGTSRFYSPNEEGFRWTKTLRADDWARHALKGNSEQTRHRADLTSDVLLWGLMSWPFVDALVVAGAVHHSSDVALQLLAIDAQAFALSGLFSVVLKTTTLRARPYTQDCIEPGSPDCNAHRANASFVSSHSSSAFTAAGLICFHHQYLPLYPGRARGLPCASAMLAATATAAMRVTADQHHLTDTLAGAAVGLVFGYLMPRLLHGRRYREDHRPRLSWARWKGL